MRQFIKFSQLENKFFVPKVADGENLRKISDKSVSVCEYLQPGLGKKWDFAISYFSISLGSHFLFPFRKWKYLFLISFFWRSEKLISFWKRNKYFFFLGNRNSFFLLALQILRVSRYVQIYSRIQVQGTLVQGTFDLKRQNFF